MDILCPYCFGEFENPTNENTFGDDKVHFRSERVFSSNELLNDLPEDYYDLDDFKIGYTGPDKNAILEKIRQKEFFLEGDDPAYTRFWDKFHGTTEENFQDLNSDVPMIRRKIIDPNNRDHQKYLKRQADGSYFIRDADGMVTGIELITGEKCYRRVCPHCHNPLPAGYGKNDVKFAVIVGVTGSGKTIYLSQLLKRMNTYMTNVGLTAMITTPSVQAFLRNNEVSIRAHVPGSTPAERFQQPLFYELIRRKDASHRQTDTFVLYDVAGEVFKDENTTQGAARIANFAPYIQHADGLIMLIDPLQLASIAQVRPDVEQLASATTVLNVLHSIISNKQSNEMNDKPIAVCLSKIDYEVVQDTLNEELSNYLSQEVESVRDSSGFPVTQFDARGYNKLADPLNKYMMANDMNLAAALRNNYQNYNFFGFTALGCDVENDVPVGPILPKRIEEPLYWLLNQMNLIGVNEPLFHPNKNAVRCPSCGSARTKELPEDERWVAVPGRKKWFKRNETMYVDHQCQECGHKFNAEGSGGAA